MGKRLTASEETALLQATVRQAHEATKELRAAIREANQLVNRLVADCQETADREGKQLSNHFQTELNRQAKILNEAVEKTREEILHQLAISEMVLDAENNTVRLIFGRGKFDDQVPLPYPDTPEKGSNP